MREITKLNLGTPFYDHFKGLEMVGQRAGSYYCNCLKHLRKEV